MAIVGITTTADAPFERVTNNQTTAAGSIEDEAIVIESAGEIQSSGNFDIRRSIIVVENGADKGLYYGGRSNTTNKMNVLENTQMLFKAQSGDIYIHVSQFKDSKAIEETDTNKVYFYSQAGANLENAVFQGIAGIEVVSPFDTLFNVTFDSCLWGIVNWESARLDLIGVSMENVGAGQYYGWLGTQFGSGPNIFYVWNPGTFDFTKIAIGDPNSRAYRGYTSTWRFKDRDSGLDVQDVLLIYRDDFAVAATFVEVGRFVSGADGILEGTVDTQNRTSGSSQDRPTLWILTGKSVLTGATGIDFGYGSIERIYTFDDVTPRLEIRSYLHEKPSGHGPADNYAISEEIGEIDANGDVVVYQDFILVPDLEITESNKATVEAYATIDTVEELYDRSKAEWRDNDDYPLISKAGSEIDLGAINLIVDATAASAWAYNGTDTITIKSSALTGTGTITTTGTITFSNGASQGTVIVFDGNTAGSVTIEGAGVSDTVEMRLNGDDSLIDNQTGSGVFPIAPANIGDEVYFQRVVSSVVVASTKFEPFTLIAGDNGIVQLYAGSEIQIANSQGITEDLDSIKTAVDRIDIHTQLV